MRCISRSFLVIALITLTSCAGLGYQIGTRVETCCPGDYDDYDNYSVSTENMPLFLRDYVVEEFENAFAGKGLSRDDQFHDLNVVLSYNHINLTAEQEGIDPFVRVESISTELTYIAEINVEMFETATGNMVWAGSISRIHHVTPGEYMHEGPARLEFRNAFSHMLQNYPDL